MIRRAAALALFVAFGAAAHDAPQETLESELAHARDAEGAGEKIPAEAFPEVVEVLDEIYFAAESGRLSAAARSVLDSVVARWQSRDANDGAFLEIRGHSDGSGTLLGNLTLARRRAEAVERYLRERGIPQERLVALALGPSDPVADEATPEGRARNRRAEIVAVATRPPR